MAKEGTKDNSQEGDQRGQPQEPTTYKAGVDQEATIQPTTKRSTNQIASTNQAHAINGDAITYCQTTSTLIWYGINQRQYCFISNKLSSTTSNITMSMVSECTSFATKSP